jgi:hypothetical protein
LENFFFGDYRTSRINGPVIDGIGELGTLCGTPYICKILPAGNGVNAKDSFFERLI